MSTSLHGQDALNMARKILGRELTPQEAQIALSEGYNPQKYVDADTHAIGFGQTGEFMNMPFDKVVNFFEDRTRKLVPDYDNLPQDLQLRLLDSTYRGGLSGSPKTLKLINSGNWDEASKEFLDNNEYRSSKEKGTGVFGRMEDTAAAMKSYGSQSKQVEALKEVPPNGIKDNIPEITLKDPIMKNTTADDYFLKDPGQELELLQSQQSVQNVPLPPQLDKSNIQSNAISSNETPRGTAPRFISPFMEPSFVPPDLGGVQGGIYPTAPQNGGPDMGGNANRTRLPYNPNATAGAMGGNILRDQFGNAIQSSTGQAIGLPGQVRVPKGATGGAKGGGK